MDFNQITYFLHLAETLNFTAAARKSGVTQPSLTKAIRKLEDELGGPLLYRDGKDTRLTALGRDVQVEFMRLDKGAQSVRDLAENSVRGRRRILNIGVASTITPQAISEFLTHVLEELPSVELQVHPLGPGEGADDVLSGKYDGCFLPSPPAGHFKLAIETLYTERLMLACASDHPLAKQNTISPQQMAEAPYMDRLNCEFHSQITSFFMDRDILMYPRFASDREDWVQQMVLSGDAVCIMPERSASLQGLAVRPVDQMDLAREIVFVVVSGPGNAMELRQMHTMARKYDWSDGN